MRSLSEAQARRCENATTRVCRCRCNGACHGKARLGQDAPREEYERLPDDDPHKLRPPKQPASRETFRHRDPQRLLVSVARHLRRTIWKEAAIISPGYREAASLAHCTVTHLMRAEPPCAWCSKWLDVNFHWVLRSDQTYVQVEALGCLGTP